jgi:hypothetical protein
LSGETTIGRNPAAGQLTLDDDPASQTQLRLTPVGATNWQARDLGRTNGTWLVTTSVTGGMTASVVGGAAGAGADTIAGR